MKRYCEKCKKETEWKEGFLLDLHVDYCTICKTAVGNLNSPKNKTPAQMQDDEPADYYDGDAVIYVIGCTETNEYFHIRGVTDKVTGADVQNEVTLVCG